MTTWSLQARTASPGAASAGDARSITTPSGWRGPRSGGTHDGEWRRFLHGRSDQRRQAMRGGLRERVVDEETGRRLHRSSHLRQARRPVRRIELERKVPVRLVGRSLEGDHHVGQREVEHLRVPRDDLAQGRGEVALLMRREVAQAPEAVAARPDVELERPSRRERHRDREARIVGHDPVAGIVSAYHVAREAGPLCLPVQPECQRAAGDQWGQMVKRIDLAVGTVSYTHLTLPTIYSV